MAMPRKYATEEERKEARRLYIREWKRRRLRQAPSQLMSPLYRWRRRVKLTQKEVGKALGVSESQISQWETGKRKPKYQTLIRMAELYGFKPDYFLKEVSNDGDV